MQNRGYIEQEIAPKDWSLGGISAMPKVIERVDGQWDAFLPSLEIQRFPWGDSQACVSYSFLNVLETLQNKRGVKFNYSDRALAKASGTTMSGNTMRKVADTARLGGLCQEALYGSEATSWNDYYKALPVNVAKECSEFAGKHTIQYETVFYYPDQICQALQYSPLQIAMYAYGQYVDGIYQNPGNVQSNHCIELYGYSYGKYWKVYDHYENSFKRLAWDYNISFIYRINIETTMPEANPLGLANNTICQLVEAPGGVGLFLDNQILVGPIEKVQFAWLMRNKTAEFDSKKRPMVKADWDKYPKAQLP